MKTNRGNSDRVIRSLLALVMVILYLSGAITGMVGIILLALSVVFLLTSAVSFCPLYTPFGLSTWGKEKKPE